MFHFLTLNALGLRFTPHSSIKMTITGAEKWNSISNIAFIIVGILGIVERKRRWNLDLDQETGKTTRGLLSKVSLLMEGRGKEKEGEERRGKEKKGLPKGGRRERSLKSH